MKKPCFLPIRKILTGQILYTKSKIYDWTLLNQLHQYLFQYYLKQVAKEMY